MSKTTHTAGPWHIGEERDCRIDVYAPDEQGEEYTVVLVCCHDGFPPGEQGEANARLVAAAPDLLAACEAMLAWADNLDSGPAVAMARAAVARAKGA